MANFFRCHKMTNAIIGLALASSSWVVVAKDYHVGPKQALASIGEVPWATLQAGDRVYIYWRSQPYAEKWVINRQGTKQKPIIISGVSGPNGERPVIDGRNAVTVPRLNYWNDDRGVINIGGSSVPANGMPSHIIIEGLEVRSAHPNYSFTDDGGKNSGKKSVRKYINNAASIYVEKATDLTLRNCVLHDSGNGLFIGSSGGETKNILIEKNYFYGNGVEGRYYEHNTYTSAINITYQFNRFGSLRSHAEGNNLKDRSAGLVVRYNWIEGGNRLLDMVDATGSQATINHPLYRETFVYGNTLIELDGGNNQVMHYGGDSSSTADYRKGTLYFYNNTLYSKRADNTTLLRLSTNEESADIRNNILYVTASGDKLALLERYGELSLSHNWIKPKWKASYEGSSFSGKLMRSGRSIEGDDPGFVGINEPDFNFRLSKSSSARNQATGLPPEVSPRHYVTMEYQPHQRGQKRQKESVLDLGAYE